MFLKTMRGLLLLIPALAAWQWFRVWRPCFEEARTALLAAAVSWSMTAVLMIEALSLVHGLSVWPIVTGWALTALLLALARPRRAEAAPGIRLDLPTRLLLAGCLIVLLVTLATALIAPPNTVDVMLYHQPRILRWLAQQSLDPFPAHNPLQIGMPPAAEYISLHLQSLAGRDWPANLPAWLSQGLCAAGVSSLAGLLGLPAAAQAAAALLALTIPEGVLAATGAKNDYVLALWLTAFALFAAEFSRRRSRWLVLLMGAAAGLAVATKGTAFVLLPPLSLLALGWPRDGWRTLLRTAAPAIVLVLLPSAGYWARNTTLFGSPLGFTKRADGTDPYKNASLSAGLTAINIIRNAGLHLGTSFPAWNHRTQSVIESAATAVGLELNDPRATWPGTKFEVPLFQRHEATQPNLIHFLLIVPALVLALWRGRGLVRYLSAALLVSFVLFCASLRWQPWHTRLHLPLFILWMPVVAWMLSQLRSRILLTAVPLLALLGAGTCLLENSVRPLWPPSAMALRPREELYFSDRGTLRQPLLDAVRALRQTGCGRIGFDELGEGYIGAFLSLLPEAEVREIDIRNPSRVLEQRQPFRPCAVVCMFCEQDPAVMAHYLASFPAKRTFGPAVVFGLEGGTHLCETRRLFGWMPDDYDGSGIWNWMDGTSALAVKAEPGSDVILSGEVITAVIDNHLLLRVDGSPAQRVPLGPLSLPLRLAPGEHRLEFSSEKPRWYPPGDTRLLGIGLKNLSVVCSGAPQPNK